MPGAMKDTIDPVRTLSLLWGIRELPRRGPKHAVTSAEVVAAAIQVADADRDLDQLSMRRVADALGVGTMSLYTYVSSREELAAAMLDTAYGEAVRDLAERTFDCWQAGLRAIADVNWMLFTHHPWVLQIFTGRPALGPNAIAKYDLELSVVDGIGLTDLEMDAALTLVLSHVEGVARSRVQFDQVAHRTGVTDQQWWAMISPAFEQVFDATRFPVAARVGLVAGQTFQAAHSPEHAYMFGLERIIDGLEFQTSRQRGTASSRRRLP
jgi:AcrR family transcriptional regulator